MKHFILVFIFITSIARASMNPTPVGMYDGFGNPISSTLNGGSYYLNTNATLSEVATVAQGGARPSLLKAIAGCNSGSGLCYSLATDTSGQLYSLLKDASGNSITSTAGSGAFAGHQGLDVSIISPISVLNPSDGPTGSAVPADANYMGMNVGGNLTGLTGTANGLKVDGSGVTQPVSGTVTANQGGAPWSQNIIQFGGNAVVTGTGAGGAGIPRVTVSSDSIIGLNAGSNIIGKVGIDQTTPGTTNRVQSNEDQIGGAAYSLGQNTMANSAPVTLASDQSAVPMSQQGRSKANAPIRNVYSTTNVTTSAWVQLVASTSNASSVICIFDSSGQTLQIGTGGSGSEVAQMTVFPGGNGCEPLKIAAGTRVAIEALSATANTGEIDVNLYQ